MAFNLGSRSIKRLKGVHPDLVKIVKRAIKISECDFTILEGLRTRKRQRYLVRIGASRTMRSRHLTGHAVDCGAWIKGRVSWEWRYYYKIADAMMQAAEDVGVPVEWGGNWRSFKDGPHFQLPRRLYR